MLFKNEFLNNDINFGRKNWTKIKQKNVLKTLRKWRDGIYLENYLFVAEIFQMEMVESWTKIIAKYFERLRIEMRKCNC